jgi:hypothetical protein
MLVTLGICRLSGGGIKIDVHRPQHHAILQKSYSSEKDARMALATFDISENAIADVFVLLPSIEENKKLTFSPMYIPQHVLAAELHGPKEK